MSLEMGESLNVKNYQDKLAYQGIPFVVLKKAFPRNTTVSSLKVKYEDPKVKFKSQRSIKIIAPNHKTLIESVLKTDTVHNWTEVINDCGGPEAILNFKILLMEKAVKNEKLVRRVLILFCMTLYLIGFWRYRRGHNHFHFYFPSCNSGE